MTETRFDSDAVALNPLPTLALALGSGTILKANAKAVDLFGPGLRAGGRIGAFLDGPGAPLAVFLEAVVHFGHYADALLRFRHGDGGAMRLQVFGARAEGGVILTFLDLDAQDRRNARTEEAKHHRAGLMHWKQIHGFFRDLEDSNRLILEAAGEGIYGIDAQGKATFVNRAAQEMLGWDAEDLIGRQLHSIIHHTHLDGSHHPACECPIYASFRNDETVRVEDDVFWRKDERPIRVEYVSTPIHDRGVLAGAVVIFRDITERLENERKLRDAMVEVEALRSELEQENAYLRTEILGTRLQAGLIGTSPAIRSLSAQIDLAADTETNVLVTGPSGSGKSLVVEALHEGSDRRKRPLVHLRCSDRSEEDLTREFLGWRRGAFRDATRDTVGKVALAANGTLHLAEVSDLPRSVQALLMDVIARRAYRRVGEDRDTPVDLRIVSTTTRELAAEVAAGRFRQDLYFALSLFPMRCEPLSRRLEDVPHLAQHFLERASARLRLPKAVLTQANVRALQEHDWPGNVRELENVVERAAILARGGKLRFEFLKAHVDESDAVLTEREIRSLERENLRRCLRRAKGKVSGKNGAAALLGVPATTVYSRMKSMDLSGHNEQSDP